MLPRKNDAKPSPTREDGGLVGDEPIARNTSTAVTQPVFPRVKFMGTLWDLSDHPALASMLRGRFEVVPSPEPRFKEAIHKLKQKAI